MLLVIARDSFRVKHIFIKHVQIPTSSTCNNLGVAMAITNDRRNGRKESSKCDATNELSGLGGTQGESLSTRIESDSIFYPDSKGGNKNREWIGFGGQETIGGIYRRLKEVHTACLRLIESQQKQLEASLQESETIATEMQTLHALLAETLDDEENE